MVIEHQALVKPPSPVHSVVTPVKAPPTERGDRIEMIKFLYRTIAEVSQRLEAGLGSTRQYNTETEDSALSRTCLIMRTQILDVVDGVGA